MHRATAISAMLLASAAVAQAETAEVNGMEMYYEVSGEGDPILVLHGSYMNIPSMGGIVPMLAETHEVYALEFQGHGRTTDINRPITYENLADDVAAFMEAVGIEKADVFGYSLGAGVGVQLAIRHPEKLDRLVAASTAFDAQGFQPIYTEFIPKMTPDMAMGSPLETSYRELAPEGDFRALAEKLVAVEHEPIAWGEEVAKIEAPVLIIVGDADVVTLEHAVEMFRLLGGGVMGDMGQPLPESRLAVLPATSHTAVITQPELLMDFIEPFLEGEVPMGMFGEAPPPGQE